MTNYYHITQYENLDSICENGLIPKNGSRTRSIGDKRCAVFLSKGVSNAILMYNSLLNHYNTFSGERGIRAINNCKGIIETYHEREKIVPLTQEDTDELEATIKVIDWIEQIMEYKDFYEYIGDGVYLTISNITNVNLDYNKDCYTNEIISPKNIKVVLLKNKQTGEIVDSRENVLSYFMSTIPCEYITSNLHNVVTIKTLKDLYNARKNDIAYYNSDNFEMEEVPIRSYLENNIKTKENNKKR